MKTIKLFSVTLLTLFISFVISSCSKSDDENNTITPNAVGVYVYYEPSIYDSYNGTGGVNIYLWINHSEINWLSEDKNDYSDYNIAIPYYPCTLNKVYELLGEVYNYDMSFMEKMEAEGKLQDYIPEFEYCKSNWSKYKYIARDETDIYLFNKTSNVNY
ncbi:hypothetical protein SAMN04488493_10455 [Xylanibacter ruminicola]|jgi:hypothetical protein|uniref:hypothetical protein n=1 Tax=Xylanibacter ruminicola TaxID=839 RepID=UPI0008E5D3A4|nr:hypothetical protein [Xylanibacter ruminicola]SFC21865.1 hypothetical protein SAMN04488493_10455 [Xylanibacter ruminicola]